MIMSRNSVYTPYTYTAVTIYLSFDARFTIRRLMNNRVITYSYEAVKRPVENIVMACRVITRPRKHRHGVSCLVLLCHRKHCHGVWDEKPFSFIFTNCRYFSVEIGTFYFGHFVFSVYLQTIFWVHIAKCETYITQSINKLRIAKVISNEKLMQITISWQLLA